MALLAVPPIMSSNAAERIDGSASPLLVVCGIAWTKTGKTVTRKRVLRIREAMVELLNDAERKRMTGTYEEIENNEDLRAD